MDGDPWLAKWLLLIQKRPAGGHVLELGCGRGWDTADLLSAGCRVITTDISTGNLGECTKSVPGASLVRMDNGKPFPFADHSLPVIIASLSLHYFSWDVTLRIASELRRCLKADGILLARFNSTNDFHYKALPTTSEIEPNFHQVGTSTKRFFDESTVRSFLHGWDIQFLEKNIIYRYESPKSVWEVMAVCPPM